MVSPWHPAKKPLVRFRLFPRSGASRRCLSDNWWELAVPRYLIGSTVDKHRHRPTLTSPRTQIFGQKGHTKSGDRIRAVESRGLRYHSFPINPKPSPPTQDRPFSVPPARRAAGEKKGWLNRPSLDGKISCFRAPHFFRTGLCIGLYDLKYPSLRQASSSGSSRSWRTHRLPKPHPVMGRHLHPAHTGWRSLLHRAPAGSEGDRRRGLHRQNQAPQRQRHRRTHPSPPPWMARSSPPRSSRTGR